MDIEIISAPHGPAPIEIREVWVGLILPVGGTLLLPPYLLPCWVEEVNSVEQAREWKFLGVKADDLPAFIVPIIPAIRRLSAKSEDAAQWFENRWKEQGRLINKFDFFFFRKDACRIV